jgi:glutaredoxin/glutathione-dependent peroxiredoxin
MSITVGERIPDVELRTMGPDGPRTVRTGEALSSGKAVLFAVPGAFTPGCSKIHLPGYVRDGRRLRERGVATIACLSVNDPWVMDAWAADQGAHDILMLADGNGEFTRAMGLEFDGARWGLGVRSQRYAAVVEDGVITALEVETRPGVDVSSCDHILAQL